MENSEKISPKRAVPPRPNAKTLAQAGIHVNEGDINR